MSNRISSRVHTEECALSRQPSRAVTCGRCGFKVTLTGDWHVDGGALIDHMEIAHTPHAVPALNAIAIAAQVDGSAQ